MINTSLFCLVIASLSSGHSISFLCWCFVFCFSFCFFCLFVVVVVVVVVFFGGGSKFCRQI